MISPTGTSMGIQAAMPHIFNSFLKTQNSYSNKLDFSCQLKDQD